jgi:Exostosin family
MAKILLTTLFPDDANSWELSRITAFRKSAKNSSHQLVSDPEEADLIFFADEGRNPDSDPYNNRFYRRYRNKCFMFSVLDGPLALVPGLYASLQKSDYDRGWARTGYYVWDCPTRTSQIIFTRYDQIPFPESPKYLCSFAGSCQNASIRQRLKELSHPRYLIVDVNRDTIKAAVAGDQDWIKKLQEQYVTLIRDTKFSLCPRGGGTNTYRLYESMAMGRAPVILSDDWVTPSEPPWDEFSIRIAERDYKSLFQILEQHEHRAEEMGKKARYWWEQYFSPEVIFDRAVESFLDIRSSGRTTKAHEHTLRKLRLLPMMVKLSLRAAKVGLLAKVKPKG